MTRASKWIKKEFLHALPAVLYFLFVFNLLDLTFGILMEKAGIPRVPFWGTVISALVVGKVIIVTDNLPFINAFSDRPLMFNTIWRTILYSLFSYFIRIIEHIGPVMSKYKEPGDAWRHILGIVSWPTFWTVQVWAFVLFFMFVAAQEMVKLVGRDKLRAAFFGR